MELNLIEIIGYMASLMVAISLTMKNIVMLRWINSIGCGIFVVYGSIIEAWPVAIMNAVIVGINMYHLLKMSRAQSETLASEA